MNTTPPGGATAAPPPPPPPHEEPPSAGPREGMNTDHLADYRAMRRSSADRKLVGVAGGLARHLDVDPLVVRVLFVVLALFGGAGLVLYAALWLLVPNDRDGSSVVRTDESTRNTLVIVAIAVAALITVTTGLGSDNGGLWFLCVLLVGGLLFHLLRSSNRDGRATETAGVPPAPAAAAWNPPTGDAGQGRPTWAPAPYTPPPPRRYRGPLLFMPTLALIALGLGVLGLLDSNGRGVPDAGYAALALTVVGVMLVVGSFFGRAGGLVLLGLVSVVALAATAIGEPSYDGERDVLVRPTSTTQLKDSYSLPAGVIEIDLSQVSEPSALDSRSLSVDVNAGEIIVVLPRDTIVDVNASIRYGGTVDTPDGLSHEGWDTTVNRTYGRGVDTSASTGDSPDTLDLDLHADFGHIEIRRG